jgi:hypothetical protein
MDYGYIIANNPEYASDKLDPTNAEFVRGIRWVASNVIPKYLGSLGEAGTIREAIENEQIHLILDDFKDWITAEADEAQVCLIDNKGDD